jgi:hypothetical protein
LLDGATYDYVPACWPEPAGWGTHAPGTASRSPAAALQFTLRHPAVTAAVIGARIPEQITSDAFTWKRISRTRYGLNWKALVHDH